jgi:hypothetical protein
MYTEVQCYADTDEITNAPEEITTEVMVKVHRTCENVV